MGLGPGCRHLVTPEPMAHGRRRESARRDSRLCPLASPGREDPVRPALETAAQGPRREEAHEGGTGGLRAAGMEAIRRGDGTGLPALAPTPDEMNRAREDA